MNTRITSLTLGSLLLFILPSGAQPPVKEAGMKYAAPRRECAVLPSSVLTYLKHVEPNYRPVTHLDYDPSWFDPNRDYYAPEMDWFNWIIRADFDGNGQDDFVLLMRGNIDGEQIAALVAIRARGDGWTHEMLESEVWDRPMTEAVYQTPPGIFGLGLADDPDPEMKRLFAPSFVCAALESCGANQYYWEKGSWHSVYIGL